MDRSTRSTLAVGKDVVELVRAVRHVTGLSNDVIIARAIAALIGELGILDPVETVVDLQKNFADLADLWVEKEARS